MSSFGRALGANVRWELRRWRRSQRMWLLLIPPIAGPIGSAIADVYLRVPSLATAEVLGLLVTGGLSAMILLDLSALAAGEELGLRAHLVSFTLPESRGAVLAARLAVSVIAPIAAYALGAALLLGTAPALVHPSGYAPAPLFVPGRLALAIPGLLLFLGGIASAAAVITRSAAQGLVAGVLAGVVAAAGVGLLVFQHQVTILLPVALALGGIAALGVSVHRYSSLES